MQLRSKFFTGSEPTEISITYSLKYTYIDLKYNTKGFGPRTWMRIVASEEPDARRDAFVVKPLGISAFQGLAHSPRVQVRPRLVAGRSVELGGRTAQQQTLLAFRDEAGRH